MSLRWFITATDTDAGKTVAACALLQACVKEGYRAIGYKPVASGAYPTDGGLRNDDGVRLWQNASPRLRYEEVNPLLFKEATSPHLAAELEEREIELGQLSLGLSRLASRYDAVVVEGAGGWFTPLNSRECLSDWVIQEGLGVILVVNMRLGCINHALLTQQAVLGAGLPLAGWIANRTAPNPHQEAAYLETLKQRLNAPMVGDIPYLAEPYQANLARFIRLDLLYPPGVLSNNR